MPSAGVDFRAVVQRHRLAALKVSKQYHGRPRLQARQLPHTARQFSTTKSPTRRDRASGRFDDAGRLMTEQERELVVDATVAVGQVGVADPARLDPHDHVVRAGIRDGDVHELHGRAFTAGDDTLNLLWHVDSSLPGVGA